MYCVGYVLQLGFDPRSVAFDDLRSTLQTMLCIPQLFFDDRLNDFPRFFLQNMKPFGNPSPPQTSKSKPQAVIFLTPVALPLPTEVAVRGGGGSPPPPPDFCPIAMKGGGGEGSTGPPSPHPSLTHPSPCVSVSKALTGRKARANSSCGGAPQNTPRSALLEGCVEEGVGRGLWEPQK